MIGLAYVHVLILYYRNEDRQTCAIQSGTYVIFYGIWNLIEFSLGSPVIMLSFGSLTIRHVRQTGKRIMPNNISTQTQNESQAQ
jgi:hypothetical protein